MRTHWKLPKQTFLETFWIYVFVSYAFFVLSSGGWTLLSVGFWGLPVAALICAIVPTLIGNEKGAVTLYAPLLLVLFGLQAAAVLLNQGDCGDNDGRTLFIHTLGGTDICHPPQVLLSLTPFAFGAYILAVAATIVIGSWEQQS